MIENDSAIAKKNMMETDRVKHEAQVHANNRQVHAQVHAGSLEYEFNSSQFCLSFPVWCWLAHLMLAMT